MGYPYTPSGVLLCARGAISLHTVISRRLGESEGRSRARLSALSYYATRWCRDYCPPLSPSSVAHSEEPGRAALPGLIAEACR